MKIDFSQTLTGIEGKAIRDLKETDELDENGAKKTVLVDVTLDEICKKALLTVFVQHNEPESLDEVKKFEYAQFAQKIFQNPSGLDVTMEEIVLLKKRIGLFFNQEVVFASYNLLDPKE